MSDLINTKQASEWNVSIVTMNGEEVSLTPLVQQVSIYESVYNNCMFGHIIFSDNVGTIETLGLVGTGEEKIKIFIETPNYMTDMDTTDFEKTFVLNSLSNVKRHQDGTGRMTFKIGFVSPFLIKNNNTKISRSFNSMSSDEIVDYIAAEVMEFGVDGDTTLISNTPTKRTKNIVIPNWRPFEVLNFLAKNSVSVDGDSDYIFYENNEGFHFTTIEALKNKPITRTITVSEVNTDLFGAEGGGTLSGNNAVKYEETERFDFSKNISKGMYGSKINTHNILTKQYETYEIVNEPLDVVLGDVGFGDVYRKEQIPNAHVGFMTSDYIYNMHSKEERSHYALYDMKMTSFRSNIIKFDIAGDSNIYAGDVIELLIPSTTGESQEMDKYMSGSFLVSAIHHKLSNAEYVMTLECTKDGFDFDVEEPIISARG